MARRRPAAELDRCAARSRRHGRRIRSDRRGRPGLGQRRRGRRRVRATRRCGPPRPLRRAGSGGSSWSPCSRPARADPAIRGMGTPRSARCIPSCWQLPQSSQAARCARTRGPAVRSRHRRRTERLRSLPTGAQPTSVIGYTPTDAEPAAVDALDIGTCGGSEPDAITPGGRRPRIPEPKGPASLDSPGESGKGRLLIVTCPRCFSFDDVRLPRRLPDGRLEYTCTGDHDGTGAYTWSTAPTAVDPPARPASTGRKAAARTASKPRTSLVAEDAAVDELLDPLLACVNVGEPFVEYGIVEYRFRMSRPDLFVAHVRERGHPMLGARRASASTSTALFARTLRRLETAGQLVMVKGPGTGAWRHDQSIGYWARPPRPTGPLLTWSMFCATQGRTAEWTDDDRALLDTS